MQNDTLPTWNRKGEKERLPLFRKSWSGKGKWGGGRECGRAGWSSVK